VCGAGDSIELSIITYFPFPYMFLKTMLSNIHSPLGCTVVYSALLLCKIRTLSSWIALTGNHLWS